MYPLTRPEAFVLLCFLGFYSHSILVFLHHSALSVLVNTLSAECNRSVWAKQFIQLIFST